MTQTRRPSAVLTAEEVAQSWKINIETVRRWIRSGELQAVDLGGPAGYRIRQAELDRFITEHLTQEKGKTMMEIESNEVAVTAFFEDRGKGRDKNGVLRPMAYVRFIDQKASEARQFFLVEQDQRGVILIANGGINELPIFYSWSAIYSIQ